MWRTATVCRMLRLHIPGPRMERHVVRVAPLAAASGTRALLSSAVLIGALGLGTACTTGRPLTVASLAGSRRLVSVSYPSAQTLRARAAGRDSMLYRVTDVVGWPTAVRGDTLDVQIAQWRADGHLYAMQPPDFTVAVLPEAGATVRAHSGSTDGGFPLVVVAALVVLGLGLALVAWGGPFG